MTTIRKHTITKRKKIADCAAPVEKPAETVNKITFVDNTKRSVLGEGRTQGLSNGFCSFKDGVLTAIDPMSPCKDYLSDRVWSEWTGRNGQACGLITKKTGIFENTDSAYMAMSVLKRGSRDSIEYPSYKSEIKLLDDNYQHMQRFINWLEESFKITGRTEVTRIESNLYMVKMPLFWTEGSYLISLLALMFRVSMYWDGKGKPFDFLTSFNGADAAYHVKGAIPKIKQMMNGNIPKQDLNQYAAPPHGVGIVYYAFPVEKKAETSTPVAATS